MRLFKFLKRSTEALLFGALVANSQLANAASGTWSVNASGNWSDPLNWTGGIIADGAGSAATFSLNITAARTVTLDSSRSIGTINIGDTASTYVGFTIDNSGGSVLTLDNNGTGASIIKSDGVADS